MAQGRRPAAQALPIGGRTGRAQRQDVGDDRVQIFRYELLRAHRIVWIRNPLAQLGSVRSGRAAMRAKLGAWNVSGPVPASTTTSGGCA